MGDLGTRMNGVNNDVQLLLARFEMALELLDQWIAEHPDSTHLVRHTESYLKRFRGQKP